MMESQDRFIGPRTMAGNPPVRRVCPRLPRSFLYKACPLQEQGASVSKEMFTWKAPPPPGRQTPRHPLLRNSFN